MSRDGQMRERMVTQYQSAATAYAQDLHILRLARMRRAGVDVTTIPTNIESLAVWRQILAALHDAGRAALEGELEQQLSENWATYARYAAILRD